MRISVLGGETTHRGLLGGTVSRPRAIALGVAVAAGLILTWAVQIPGIVIGLLLVGVAWFATIRTDNDTPLTRFLDRAFWRQRVRLGTDKFVPYDDDTWEALSDAWGDTHGRKASRQAVRDLHAVRETPDGIEGMTWLQDGVGEPGIQWHREAFTEEYLAVAFTTTGQVEGIETDVVFDHASEGFSRMNAGFAEPSSLVRRVQTLSRVLPADPSRHEAWLTANADPTVPAAVLQSLKQVSDGVHAGQLMQRPMMVFSWPITPRFEARAARRGEGLPGWRDLMATEIKAVGRALIQAGYRDVEAATARQTAAVIRHMQHPGFALEKVADLTPTTGWVPSEDSWSYTTYIAAPDGSTLTQSLCRTARIHAGDVEVSERTSLWLAPLLGGMSNQVVRTIAFHQELIPQPVARYYADQDLVSDVADANRKRREGVIDDADLDVSKTAVIRRREDLLPGSGHAGANWVGYLTISAGDERALMDACDAVEEGASAAGINRLRWLDARQSAAHAGTWPVGRGIKPSGQAPHMRLQQFAAGKGPKDAL